MQTTTSTALCAHWRCTPRDVPATVTIIQTSDGYRRTTSWCDDHGREQTTAALASGRVVSVVRPDAADVTADVQPVHFTTHPHLTA